MTNKVYKLNAEINPQELTAEEFKTLAKRGLVIKSYDNIYHYYYQYNPRHKYPYSAERGYRKRYSWSRTSTYMSSYDFSAISRRGGTVIKTPPPSRISKVKPCA